MEEENGASFYRAVVAEEGEGGCGSSTQSLDDADAARVWAQLWQAGRQGAPRVHHHHHRTSHSAVFHACIHEQFLGLEKLLLKGTLFKCLVTGLLKCTEVTVENGYGISPTLAIVL